MGLRLALQLTDIKLSFHTSVLTLKPCIFWKRKPCDISGCSNPRQRYINRNGTFIVLSKFLLCVLVIGIDRGFLPGFRIPVEFSVLQRLCMILFELVKLLEGL